MYRGYDRLIELENAYKTLLSIIEEGSCFTLKKLAINGNDLIELGITNGKIIGQILNDCLNEVIEEKISNTKEDLLNKIKKINLFPVALDVLLLLQPILVLFFQNVELYHTLNNMV